MATACDWLFNYVVVQTTPPGIHHLKWGLYLIYALLNATFVPLVYYLVVETQGRSLEETDGWFERNRGWLVHEADHTIGGPSKAMNAKRLGNLQIGDDHEIMLDAFRLSGDGDGESEGSPVTRRGSYPMSD